MATNFKAHAPTPVILPRMRLKSTRTEPISGRVRRMFLKALRTCRPKMVKSTNLKKSFEYQYKQFCRFQCLKLWISSLVFYIENTSRDVQLEFIIFMENQSWSLKNVQFVCVFSVWKKLNQCKIQIMHAFIIVD